MSERPITDPAGRSGGESETFALEQELLALGGELSSLMPAIHLETAVMAGLASFEDAEAGLEEELLLLGDALAGAVPEAGLQQRILERIEAQVCQENTELKTELRAIGAEMREKQPVVDIAEPVLDAVPARTLSETVDFTRHRKQRRRESWASRQMLLTAAACLLLVFGVLFTRVIRPELTRLPGSVMQTARTQASGSEESASAKKEAREGEALSLTMGSSQGEIVLSALKRPAPYTEEQGTEQKARHEEHSLQDILDLRRQAADGKSDALALLARWGALDPDQARKLLAEGSLSPADLVALSRFLPADEAMALLREAIEVNPEDPGLRLALARMLLADPKNHAEAQRMQEALRNLDPGNSLAYFMDAQVRFAAGDYVNALESLQEASRLSFASAYGLSNAQHHRAVLEAAGYPAETAGALAAFYAGTEEYGYLEQMRNDLLDYGSYFESIGDYESAFAIYKSIGELGGQLLNGAAFGNEQLAGLDMQTAAMEAISQLLQILKVPGASQVVESSYELFAEGLDLFLENLGRLDDYLKQGSGNSVVETINGIMQYGDIRFFPRERKE
ncbi:MAG TPA: hypothetical protein PLY90_03165 [Candidatus Hydrogenedentes bacterium]|jgi:tetratricopeptide (TPR) repeat protein|nr:MAG: hypothetical protein BWY07_01873 [Candidatus Hydrogenedentes bacterium ADurb.Bin170]HQB02275.1 hypothetical protein [Candidatus Hydrogenedentota bacterium]